VQHARSVAGELGSLQHATAAAAHTGQ
jgi:hypothetical protein